MKRNGRGKQLIISLLLIIILVISITGCQSKGLTTYQEAIETTNSIEKGELKMEVDTVLNFDKTGLSFEEEKQLNDFEQMSGSITSKFDITKELLDTNIYFYQGGTGIDFSLFTIDNQLILQLPIINLYMVLSEEDMINIDDEEDSETINTEGLTIDFDDLMKSWISVFNEEDVVVGNNTYILTNEGKLKTTKYSFNLDQEQLKTLEELLVNEIDMNALNQIFLDQISNYNDTEEVLDFDIEEILAKISLTSLEGEAFVDFDNRLIRQNFILKGEGVDVVPGDLESFEIKFEMTYTNLGEEQSFDFPTLTDENVVDQEKLNEIFETFER